MVQFVNGRDIFISCLYTIFSSLLCLKKLYNAHEVICEEEQNICVYFVCTLELVWEII